MPNPKEIVINTGPILALVAALGDLTILQKLYRKVFVPLEVSREILAAGSSGFAIRQFNEATWLNKIEDPTSIDPFLRNSLDLGEASVIQLAINEAVATVCIDEALGRRIGRLHGLQVTGSIGILLRAKKEGHPLVVKDAIQRMQDHGIWLGSSVVKFALKESGESG